MRVGVVYGGYSSEKESSTENAKYIGKTLEKLGYQVVMIAYSCDLVQQIKQEDIDIVYVSVQGKGHGDGTIQAMLDHEHIPYTGSKMEAANLINNKIMSKLLFDHYHIRTPKWCILHFDEYHNQSCDYEEIGYPFVAKAPSQGGSFGIELIHGPEELPRMERVFQYDNPILLEQFIEGTFYTVGVLEKNGEAKALSCIEGIELEHEHPIIRKDKMTLFTGEYSARLADVSQKLKQEMEETAVQIFKIMNAEDIARIDYMLSEKDGFPYVLEINAVPGLKPKSLLPREAAFCNISYEALIEGILLTAWEKAQRKGGWT